MNRLLAFTLLLMVFSLSIPSSASPYKYFTVEEVERPKVAVVFSGGGAKGMAHIGVLKVLEKAGIPIDIVTGTSMGSIIGGLYAAGYRADELKRIVNEQDWTFVLSDKENPLKESLSNRRKQNTYFLSKVLKIDAKGRMRGMNGLIEGKNLNSLFAQLTRHYPDSMSFDKLTIPFACVATNIMDNTEYVFRSGRLAEAMRASMAIPGVFSPVCKGEKVLIDGGLKNNYPVDVAREMGADYVIGVTLQSKPRTADQIMSTGHVLGQIVDINCKNKYDSNLKLTDIHISVDTKGFSVMGFTKTAVDSLIYRGEQAAMKQWDELIKLKEQLNLSPQDVVKATEKRINLPAADSLSLGAGRQERMTSAQLRAGLGVRFDTEELVALQLNGEWHPKSSPWWMDATLRLGKRIMGRLDFNFHPEKKTEMRFSYIYHHNDMHIYNEGYRAYNIVFNQHTLDLSLFNFDIRNFNVNMGVKWNYYSFNSLLVGLHLPNVPSSKDSENYFMYYANVKYNSENKGYFPEYGACFDAGFSYLNDNFWEYRGHVGLSLVNALWGMSFPINGRLTFQPMIYGRLVFGTDIPYSQQSVVGGDVFGRYMGHQMPFAGIGYMEQVDRQLVALRLRLQQRIADNNYLLATVAAAQQAGDLHSLLQRGPMLGYQLAYFYNTMFGPLGATLGYSNRTNRPYFYINLGFSF